MGESNNKRSSLRDLRSERATPRATDGSAASSMKLHLMQGWLRLSWLPISAELILGLTATLCFIESEPSAVWALGS